MLHRHITKRVFHFLFMFGSVGILDICCIWRDEMTSFVMKYKVISLCLWLFKYIRAKMFSISIILFIKHIDIYVSAYLTVIYRDLQFQANRQEFLTRKEQHNFLCRTLVSVPKSWKNLIKDALKKEWINFNLMQVGCNMPLFLLCMCILMHDLFLLYSCKIFAICFNEW